jgi:prolyl-tRNA synthetase
VGLDSHVKIYADNIIKGRYNLAAGANKKDCHLINVNYPRDFKVDLWGDFSFASEGDLCINCKCPIKFEKGIEIGHIFKLGTKYSEKMGALFLDSEGKLNPIIMGCYGIGVSRILAAVIEQLYDGKGILWPTSIAPFMVNLVAINMEDLNIASNAEKIYQMLLKEGIEVIFDDRNVRAGVKFKDSDLIGIPIKLIVGKNYTENEELEIELRKDGTKIKLAAGEALDFIKSYSEKNLF